MAERSGEGILRLWYEGLRDRLRGDHARANARWGHLRPPQGRGRVVWIKTGARRQSVHLAAELTGAIRERRRDVRLVLTFERDYPELVNAHLAGMARVGVGYGPCDAPRAVRRAVKRLDPFALIVVDTAIPHNLLAALDGRGNHVVAYAAPPPENGAVEAAYPATAVQAAAWKTAGSAGFVAPCADPLSLLTEAQVEPTLRSLVCGGRELRLFWAHGIEEPRRTAEFMAAWRYRLHRSGVLFISTDPAEDTARLMPVLSAAGLPVLRISRWRREPLDAGTVVLVDGHRWLAALSASCHHAYLTTAARSVYWQTLAGGVPLAVGPGVLRDHPALREAAVPVVEDYQALMEHWAERRVVSQALRARSDACRRLFWRERRRAADNLQELLQRIFDW